jgi:O-antigen ligase
MLVSNHPSWFWKLHERKVEWLILLFVFLLPFGEASHLPVLILLLLSIHGMYKREIRIDAGTRPLIWLAALLIVPLLITASTAYDPIRTLRTVLVFSLYAIAGFYVIVSFKKHLNENLLLYGIAAILLFWTTDALLQFFSGRNLFGWPYNGSRVSGIYNRNMWIGYTLAHLSPFYLEALRRYASKGRRKWAWLLILPFIAVILLSGGRAAWLTMAIVACLYPIYLIQMKMARWHHIGLMMAMLAIIVAASIAISPALEKRMDTSMLAFSMDLEAINKATSLRVDVWSGAWHLFLDAPIIGHGTHAYDPLAHDRGYTQKRFGHEHLYGLQIMVTTGTIGFLAYLLGFFTLCRQFVTSLKQRLITAIPWLATLLILFPLNAHWNFYAPRPASLMWILLIMAFAIDHHHKKR